MRQILYLCISIIKSSKSLEQFNQVIITIVNIDENKLVITEIKPFYLHFDLPRNDDSNLKHEVDHFIKHNGFLAEHRMKNEIEQLLFQYKHELKKKQ